MNASVTPPIVTTGEKAAWVQAWASVVGGLAAIVGIAFLIAQINFAKEQYLAYKAERKSDKMEKFYTEWTAPTMLFNRANAAASHPKDSAYLVEVFSFFERVAMAKNNDLVTIDDMSDYFQDAILTYWCGFEDFVRRNRIQSGEDPMTGSLWSEFEKAVNELKKQKHARCMSGPEIVNNMKIEQDRYQRLVVSAPQTAAKK